MPTAVDWKTTWTEAGAKADERLFDKLIACYREPHRKYHTLQHLTECFDNFRQLRTLANFPAEIQIALWFHDAVYDVRRNDNELRSAKWARESMLAAGAAPEAAERVHGLVMATCHNAMANSRDADVLVDVDLWILGAAAPRFDEYERQIRDEYSWVPDFMYRRERKKILQQFDQRPRIFNTDLFFARHEITARANIARSRATLGG